MTVEQENVSDLNHLNLEINKHENPKMQKNLITFQPWRNLYYYCLRAACLKNISKYTHEKVNCLSGSPRQR